MEIFILSMVALVTQGSAQVQVSQAEFNNGVTSNGFPTPSWDQYNGFVNSIPEASISSKMESAMYLAQLLHESGGLLKKREDGCDGPDGCAWKYPASDEWNPECQGANYPQGRSFYGRGYIQLTYCSNYLPASRALGFGDDLKWNPDTVATSEDRAWGVSAWYWSVNVHGALGGTDEFGRTTKAINGRLECSGSGQNCAQANQRFQYYQNVFYAFNLGGTPNPAGCNC